MYCGSLTKKLKIGFEDDLHVVLVQSFGREGCLELHCDRGKLSLLLAKDNDLSPEGSEERPPASGSTYAPAAHV